MNRQKKIVVALGLCVMMGMSGLEANTRSLQGSSSNRRVVSLATGYTVVKDGKKQVGRMLTSRTLGQLQAQADENHSLAVNFTDTDGQPAVYVPASPRPTAPPADQDGGYQPPAHLRTKGKTAGGADDGDQQTGDDMQPVSGAPGKKKKQKDFADFTSKPIEKVNFRKIIISDKADDDKGYSEGYEGIESDFNRIRNAQKLAKGSRTRTAEMLVTKKGGATESQTATVYKAGASAEAKARRRAVEDMRSNVEEHVATESAKIRTANSVFVNRIFGGAKDVIGAGQNTELFRNVRSAYTGAYKDENKARDAALKDANDLANLYAKHGSSTTVFKRFKSNIREKMQTLSGGQLACYVGAGLLLSPIKGPLLLFGALVAISKIPSALRRRRLEKPLKAMLAAYDITDDGFVAMRTMARKVDEANDPKATLDALNGVVEIFRNNATARHQRQQDAQALLRDEDAEITE